tara:strand:- start:410 stop:646 length:237 start_codon:yes stop_codon:yes gene_type:complete
MKIKNKQPWGEKIQDARIADKRIKHCIKCNVCWEAIYYGQKKQTYFYYNFPSYGKEKKVCFKCKGEHNEQNGMDKLSV